MKIDYDGIALVRESELNESERYLITALIDAMNDGEIPTVSLNTKWIICDYCDGEGSHSRRFGTITSDDWHEWDEESRHEYMSGRYDERCQNCKGSGKVRALHEEALPTEIQDYIQRYRQDSYDSAMESYYERLAGC
jgi:hypothetical protein